MVRIIIVTNYVVIPRHEGSVGGAQVMGEDKVACAADAHKGHPYE
jgi:hypothetical protein